MKKALITGITGQDGSYLAELLRLPTVKFFDLLRANSMSPVICVQFRSTCGESQERDSY